MTRLVRLRLSNPEDPPEGAPQKVTLTVGIATEIKLGLYGHNLSHFVCQNVRTID